MTLSRILDAERARQGLTVYRMGLTAGIGQSALTRILDGTVESPEFGTVVKLLAALGKSLTWLDKQLKSESPVDVSNPSA